MRTGQAMRRGNYAKISGGDRHNDVFGAICGEFEGVTAQGRPIASEVIGAERDSAFDVGIVGGRSQVAPNRAVSGTCEGTQDIAPEVITPEVAALKSPYFALEFYVPGGTQNFTLKGGRIPVQMASVTGHNAGHHAENHPPNSFHCKGINRRKRPHPNVLCYKELRSIQSQCRNVLFYKDIGRFHRKFGVKSGKIPDICPFCRNIS